MQRTEHITLRATILLFFITTLFFVSVFGYVSAQEGYVPLSPLPGINAETFSGDTTSDLSTSYLQNMFLLAIGIAAALAVIMIAYGGLQYVTSAAFSTKEAGKNRIWAAIGGIILIFSAWLILNTINPELLNLNFDKIKGGMNNGTPSNPSVPFCFPLPSGETVSSGSEEGCNTVLTAEKNRLTIKRGKIMVAKNAQIIQGTGCTPCATDSLKYCYDDYTNGDITSAVEIGPINAISVFTSQQACNRILSGTDSLAGFPKNDNLLESIQLQINSINAKLEQLNATNCNKDAC